MKVPIALIPCYGIYRINIPFLEFIRELYSIESSLNHCYGLLNPAFTVRKTTFILLFYICFIMFVVYIVLSIDHRQCVYQKLYFNEAMNSLINQLLRC